jgi:hypothetical protein
MQVEQARFRLGMGPPHLLPVFGVQHDLQRLPELAIKQFSFGNHQLAVPQVALGPGVQQLAVAEQPYAGPAGVRPLYTGQCQGGIGSPQSWELHLQEALAQGGAHHQGQGGITEGQGHQQADQPAGIAARGQPHQGVITTAQAAGHQAAEGEVMGPAFAPLPLQQGLEPVVGAGLEHPPSADGSES